MNKLADAVNPEADDEFSYREGTSLANFMAPPAFLRNPVIPMPRGYQFRDCDLFPKPLLPVVEDAFYGPAATLHRLEDVAATFGVDLDDVAAPAVGRGGHDPVSHPSHYTSHPSGVECIDIAEHMNFNLGNVVKYVWRAGSKGDTMEDLLKAEFYIKREIGRLSS